LGGFYGFRVRSLDAPDVNVNVKMIWFSIIMLAKQSVYKEGIFFEFEWIIFILVGVKHYWQSLRKQKKQLSGGEYDENSNKLNLKTRNYQRSTTL
jgi:hypothetical protein